MVGGDILSIIDLSQLRLVESACEGSCRAWSEIARNAIDRTERETIDQRTATEQSSRMLPLFLGANSIKSSTAKSIHRGGCPSSLKKTKKIKADIRKTAGNMRMR